MDTKDKEPSTWHAKLKIGLLLTDIKGGARQPHQYAMSMISKGYYRWQTAQQYNYEIERILQEMKMSIYFAEHIPEDSFFENRIMTQEEYIMYHQGYFFDLVHQLKDKLCHMVRAIVTYEKDLYTKEFEDNISKKKVLTKILDDSKVQKIKDLVDALEEWKDEGNDVIARALKKRTHYHHFKNPLVSNEQYVQAKTHRFMQNNEHFQSQLSEYGKKAISEHNKESHESWKKETISTMSLIFKGVESNIEKISKSIVTYFRLPSYSDKKAKIALRLWFSFEKVPKNMNSLENLGVDAKNIFTRLSSEFLNILGDKLVAFYLTGSLARKEYIPYLSDVNLILVVKDIDEKQTQDMKILIDSSPKRAGLITNSLVLFIDDFESDKHFKTRFACRYDGILLAGKDITKEEKEHRLSFRLVYKLNKDIRDAVDGIKNKLTDNSINLSQLELADLAHNVVKRMFRLGFGQVVGNKIVYTSSFKEMKDLMNFYYPENRKLTNGTYFIVIRRIGIDREGLLSLIREWERMFYPLLEAIEKICGADAKKSIDSK